MSDNSYSLTTKKTWHQTNEELEDQMRRWGVTEWETNYPKGARSEAGSQKEEDRTVKLTYKKNGKTVTLVMGKQDRAVDNLRVLYLAVEAMRLNERRGISDVLESAYLQLAVPTQAIDPYELLEIRPDASLEVAEAVYKTKVRNIHPDRGGSTEHMKALNRAIDEIRKKFK
ncbi:MAG TPA: J domain-containing protein [Methylomirabilota bacterium]|nr:J domain-containing protein [Methylomirabilota bacterium]